MRLIIKSDTNICMYSQAEYWRSFNSACYSLVIIKKERTYLWIKIWKIIWNRNFAKWGWIKNRFVLAPLTHISSNDDGTISDVEIPYIEKRSKDVGLAINAASNVNDIGKAFPGQPSVAHDSDIEGLKRLAQAMKKNGAKALVQIHHGGAQALANLTPNGDVVAPSPITLKASDNNMNMMLEKLPLKKLNKQLKISVKQRVE